MQGRWCCHETTIAIDIAVAGIVDDTFVLSQQGIAAGSAAEAKCGAVLSFRLCQFCVDHRVRLIDRGGYRADFSRPVNYIINIFGENSTYGI
jgi:hypothetical protein